MRLVRYEATLIYDYASGMDNDALRCRYSEYNAMMT